MLSLRVCWRVVLIVVTVTVCVLTNGDSNRRSPQVKPNADVFPLAPRTESPLYSTEAFDVIPTTTSEPASPPTSARVATVPPRIVESHTDAWFDGLSICEQSGDWTAHGYGANGDGVYYSGGLGIALSTWLDNGGAEFASEGAFASREQQIVVARRIWARFGDGAWGGSRCANRLVPGG